MRSDAERLKDIIDAIEKIEKHASNGREVFEKDELVQVWVVHHLQIIGEASSKLSASIREQHPDIPWTKIVAMRNLITHAYFGIDLGEIWATVTNDLPMLKTKVNGILG